MKKLIPLFVLGTIASAHGQVVIDQADFATVGTTITFGDNADTSDDTLTFDMGGVGSGQVFDCSTLETDELFDVGFYDPSTVQGGSDFPTADLAVDQIGGIYGFTTIDAGSVDIIGLGGDFAEQLGLPGGSVVLSLAADDPWTLFEFPAQLGSPVLLDTAVFEGRFSADLLPSGIEVVWDPAPDSVWIKRVVYYEADIVGDGTLTDPVGGVHNVLKMNVIENNIDTLWGRNATTGEWEDPPIGVSLVSGLPSNETVYRTRFISKELGYYVVDVTTDSNGTPQSATFVSDQSECCTSVEEVIANGENVIYPNPTSDFVRVRTGGDIYQLNILDMSGKLLRSERLTIDGQTVELHGMATGLYLFQMLDEDGQIAHTGRLSVVR